MIIILLVMILLLMIPGMRQVIGAFIWIFIILMWWNWPADTNKSSAPTIAPTVTERIVPRNIPAQTRNFVGDSVDWNAKKPSIK